VYGEKCAIKYTNSRLRCVWELTAAEGILSFDCDKLESNGKVAD